LQISEWAAGAGLQYCNLEEVIGIREERCKIIGTGSQILLKKQLDKNE
jgi:hypothetical protein